LTVELDMRSIKSHSKMGGLGTEHGMDEALLVFGMPRQFIGEGVNGVAEFGDGRGIGRISFAGCDRELEEAGSLHLVDSGIDIDAGHGDPS